MKLTRLFALAALAVVILTTAFAATPAQAYRHKHHIIHHRRVWRNHHWITINL